MNRCRTIAVANLKGGVGKTTTAVNLAACLALCHQKRCLLVDMDPQANATRYLLGGQPQPKHTLREFFLGHVSDLHGVVTDTEIQHLTLAPSDLALSEAEFRLGQRPRREFILHDGLSREQSAYDYILIDCPPQVGLLTLNALAAADRVVIPCESQFLALTGLQYMLDVVELTRARINPRLTILGVVVTKFHILSIANRDALAWLRQQRQTPVFKTVIPRDVRAEEAPNFKPLQLFAPGSRAARAYNELAKEVHALCQDQD